MAGFDVKLNVADAVSTARSGFEVFGSKVFARAVQYSLNRVVVEGVNDFRNNEMPIALRHMNAFTKQGVRYELDKRRLADVEDVDQVASAAFIQPLQSAWLKYSLGEETRPAGDIGIEGWFKDQSQIYIPNERGLAAAGIRTTPGGSVRGVDAKRIASALAKGVRVSGGARFGGAFQINPGDPDPARLGVGIHMRPMRGVAVVERSRVRDKLDRKKRAPRYDGAGNEIRVKDRRKMENRYSLLSAPTTEFVNGRGRQVSVPKVVNLGRPELLFVTRPEGHYKAPLSPRWERAMEKAAGKIGDYLAEELADKLEHAVRKGRLQ